MIVQADARTLPLVDACVQCVVTSPPYWGLRDYGVPGQIGLEPTPEAYVASLVAVFREVWRVLKADGVCWLNLGDSYASNSCIGRKDSFTGRIIDGRIVTAKQRRKPTAIDRCEMSGLAAKQLIGIPWRVAFALQAEGWYLRSDIIWAKPNPMPESVTDRPTKAHEYVFLLAKQERYYYDADAIVEPNTAGTLLRARYAAARYVHDKRRDSHDPGKPTWQAEIRSGGRNRRTVWTVATQPYPGAHFATMPEALIEPCILAGSRPGDRVLDPFGGSGTVGRVAVQLARRAVCVDLNPAYLALAQGRTTGITYGLPLEGSV